MLEESFQAALVEVGLYHAFLLAFTTGLIVCRRGLLGLLPTLFVGILMASACFLSLIGCLRLLLRMLALLLLTFSTLSALLLRLRLILLCLPLLVLSLLVLLGLSLFLLSLLLLILIALILVSVLVSLSTVTALLGIFVRSLVTVFPAAALGRTAPRTFGGSVFRTFSTALWERVLLDILVEEFLYLVEGKHVILIDQGDCHTIAVSTCRTADAVHIVLGIVRHVVVDDHGNIIDINATGHDIRGNEHVNLTALKLEHDIVALGLFKVRVHLTAVDLQLL